MVSNNLMNAGLLAFVAYASMTNALLPVVTSSLSGTDEGANSVETMPSVAPTVSGATLTIPTLSSGGGPGPEINTNATTASLTSTGTFSVISTSISNSSSSGTATSTSTTGAADLSAISNARYVAAAGLAIGIAVQLF